VYGGGRGGVSLICQTGDMVNRERLNQFRFRFGIVPDGDALKKFQIRIIHAAVGSLRTLDNEERAKVENEFGLRNGSNVRASYNYGGVHISHGIIEEIQNAENFPELIERTQHLLWTFEELDLFTKKDLYSNREAAGLKFAVDLKKAIELSPGIDVRIQVMGHGVEFVPAGIEILDDVVDQVVQWLSKYPDAQKEFRQTLTILAEKRREQYRQAQDSLRFALEKILKHLLGNNIPLEEQGRNLKEWLARRGVAEDLRNIVVQIMILLNKHYQNAAVKHDNAIGDGSAKEWEDHEVEYLLYQQATLLRLLLEASEHDERP
jgi:hypothetical protein